VKEIREITRIERIGRELLSVNIVLMHNDC